jgi:hypothetical protein
MQDTELINLWKSYDKKLDENLLFNKKNAEQITELKVQSLLASMKPLKIVAIILGVVWVGFIDVLIINLFFVANPFFLISAIIQVLLTKLAIGIYLYQLILIHKVDISEPIVKTQEKLARLKSSTLWVARFLFLQLPIWTTFYLNESMLENGNIFLYAIQLLVTFSLTVMAVWLFRNIKYDNRDKKWFQFLFSGSEWTPIIKSLEFTNDLKAFRNETH